MEPGSRDVERTREHRSHSIETLIQELPQVFETLIETTLLPKNVLDASVEEIQDYFTSRPVTEVEGLMLRDPFVCGACGPHKAQQEEESGNKDESATTNTNSPKKAAAHPIPPQVPTRMCPVTNKPHPRLLIECANRFLGLVAEARASIVISKDPTPAIPTTGSMSNMSSPISPSPTDTQFPPNKQLGGGNNNNNDINSGNSSPTASSAQQPQQVRAKVKRPMPRKPHLLVLAFHAASSPAAGGGSGDEGQDDEMRKMAATIVMTVVNIYRTVALEKGTQNFQRRLQRLLITFDRAWRVYVGFSVQALAAARGPQGEQKSHQQIAAEIAAEQLARQAAAAAASSGGATASSPSSATSTSATSPPPSGSAVPQSGSGFSSAIAADNNNQATTSSSSMKPSREEMARRFAAAISVQPRTRTPPGDRDDNTKASGGDDRAQSDNDATTSPEPAGVMRPVAPPFSTRGNSTSDDSDNDASSAAAASSSSSLGGQHPFLANLTPEQQQQVALNHLLEQKRRGDEAQAREAYSARIRMRMSNSFQDIKDRFQKMMESVSEDVESKIFLEELQHRPPKMDRIPFLLRRITESLLAVIPSQRLRAQLERELQDVLDWDTLKNAGLDSVARVMRYVIGKVIELGAPAREETLRAELDTLVGRLSAEEPSAVVVDAIRFLRASVRQLGEDIMKAQLALVRPELAKRAVALQRKYLEEWTASPPNWLPSTKEWVKKHIIVVTTTTTKQDGDDKQAAKQDNNIAVNWDDLKTRVLAGILDLLRSSGRPADKPRWGEYPTELLYFEKPVIFTLANHIQMLVVRMMVCGTTRAILKDYISAGHMTHGQIQAFESKLDRKLVEWLAGSGNERMSIAQLKDAVEGEVQFVLNENNRISDGGGDGDDAGSGTDTITMLKPVHVTQLRGVMDQMIDLTSAVYSTFERKILKVMSSLVLKELRQRSVSRGSNVSEDTVHRQENADELAALGANVAADVSNAVLDLTDVIEHHISVYATHYEFLLGRGASL